MSAWRACGGLLSCALALACGERAGDPIVALQEARGEAGATSTGGSGGSGGSGGTASSSGADGAPLGGDGAGGEPGTDSELGPTGLCGACTSSDACGDANDACIRHQGQSFCGRDCDEQGGCPDGYGCVQLANSQLWQCVPQTTCPTPSTAPTLDELRPDLLGRINAARAVRSLSPLSASSCLDELAQTSAIDLARTDEALGKYVKECDPVWPNCACGWSGEAELSIARYGLDWTAAVARAVDTTRSDRFNQAFLSSDFTDVGIGFWLSADEAWIALSFR